MVREGPIRQEALGWSSTSTEDRDCEPSWPPITYKLSEILFLTNKQEKNTSDNSDSTSSPGLAQLGQRPPAIGLRIERLNAVNTVPAVTAGTDHYQPLPGDDSRLVPGDFHLGDLLPFLNQLN